MRFQPTHVQNSYAYCLCYNPGARVKLCTRTGPVWRLRYEHTRLAGSVGAQRLGWLCGAKTLVGEENLQHTCIPLCKEHSSMRITRNMTLYPKRITQIVTGLYSKVRHILRAQTTRLCCSSLKGLLRQNTTGYMFGAKMGTFPLPPRTNAGAALLTEELSGAEALGFLGNTGLPHACHGPMHTACGNRKEGVGIDAKA